MNIDTELILKDKFGDGLELNVPMRGFTGIAVGGVADYFYRANSIEELVKAVNICLENNVPYFILGGGYNIVVSDSGFPGLVIKNESSNIFFGLDSSEVIVDSGVSLGKLINLAAGKDLGGLEFLCGVPGTIGGAVYGNAGSSGYQIGDFVKSVTMLMPRKDKIAMVRKLPDWMEFAYRSTKLKNDYKNERFKPIILTIRVQLARRRKDEILRFIKENLALKKKNQPLEEKSAGSFFKNPDEKNDLSAGYLLDKAGAKKLRVNGAVISKKHANFILNQRDCRAEDIRKLADLAKEVVYHKYNIELEEEIEYVGRW